MILQTRIPAVLTQDGKPPESACIMAIFAIPPGLPGPFALASESWQDPEASAIKPALVMSYKTGKMGWFSFDEVRGSTQADVDRFQEIEALEQAAKEPKKAEGEGGLVTMPNPGNPVQGLLGFFQQIGGGPLKPQKTYRKKAAKARKRRKK